jgi:hypothetical protein
VVTKQNSVGVNCKNLVITGPGRPIRVEVQPKGDYDCILDGYNFWQDLPKMQGFFSIDTDQLEDHSIAVIGSGGTAATIVAGLIERTNAPITVLSRSATLYSRGESYFEVRALSDPWDWTELPLDLRRELIGRIDRGVVSAQNMRLINAAPNVKHVRMSVSKIEVRKSGDGSLTPSVIGEVVTFDPIDGAITVPVEVPADFVVDAGKFDAWWFTELLVGELKAAFQDADLRSVLESTINDHLELDFSLPKDKLLAGNVPADVADKFLRSHPCRGKLHLAVPTGLRTMRQAKFNFPPSIFKSRSRALIRSVDFVEWDGCCQLLGYLCL